jgi:hypothetical protein
MFGFVLATVEIFVCSGAHELSSFGGARLPKTLLTPLVYSVAAALTCLVVRQQVVRHPLNASEIRDAPAVVIRHRRGFAQAGGTKGDTKNPRQFLSYP